MELTGDAAAPAAETTTTMSPTSTDNDPSLQQPRTGTICSARFNILCTMVGGGCLSLPMGFQKTGNAFLAPCFLALTAALTDACFRMIVASVRQLSPVHSTTTVVGKESYESLASAAFGARGYLLTKWIVTLICVFGATAYAVLLRDLLQPIADHFTPPDHHHTIGGGPTVASNLTMLSVILLVTPLCALRNLSSLEQLGAASMGAILIVGSCIVYRSTQCLMGDNYSGEHYHWPAFQFWPDNAKDVLDAFPLFVSCYVCHYNIPLVHNELQEPTSPRVQYWLRSTTISATLFYMVVGIFGSAYGHCTPSGKVSGNILLDFDQHDPLLLIARMCLACTVTLAFPLLVIPARDIILRTWSTYKSDSGNSSSATDSAVELSSNNNDNNLEEPLLASNNEGTASDSSSTSTPPPEKQFSWHVRLGVAIVVLWSAAGVASCVASIDVVWDLLGSSLSIVLSYLIPAASFLAIFGGVGSSSFGVNEDVEANVEGGGDENGEATANDTDDNNSDTAATTHSKGALLFAKGILVVYIPLMFISSGNAFYDTFFKH